MSKANGTPLATADSTCSLVMAESSRGVDESTTPSLRRSTPAVSNRMKRFVLVFVTQKSACSPCPLRSIASFGSPRTMSALRSSMSVHLEFVGTGARATPPAGGAVHRFVPLTVALQRCVLRTSRRAPSANGRTSPTTSRCTVCVSVRSFLESLAMERGVTASTQRGSESSGVFANSASAITVSSAAPHETVEVCGSARWTRLLSGLLGGRPC